MKRKLDYTVTHVIAKTSKEEKELHMKQALVAMLKMTNKESITIEKLVML